MPHILNEAFDREVYHLYESLPPESRSFSTAAKMMEVSKKRAFSGYWRYAALQGKCPPKSASPIAHKRYWKVKQKK